MTIQCAAFILDCEERDVMQRIHNGSLPWAFDLATQYSTASFPRVLSRSVSNLAQGIASPDNESLESVIASILAPHIGTIKGTQLAHQFLCGPEHVIKLLKEGFLVSVGQCGPKVSPTITKASIVKFLTSRRIL